MVLTGSLRLKPHLSLTYGLFTQVVSELFLRVGSLSTEEHGLDSCDSDQAADLGGRVEVRGRGKASSAAQTPRLNPLFIAGWLVRVSVKYMHVLEEAADDTDLTVQQVAVGYQDVT